MLNQTNIYIASNGYREDNVSINGSEKFPTMLELYRSLRGTRTTVTSMATPPAQSPAPKPLGQQGNIKILLSLAGTSPRRINLTAL